MSVFSAKFILLAPPLDTEQKGQVERRYSYLRLLSSFFSVFAVKETLASGFVRLVLVLKAQFQINFTAAVLAVMTSHYSRHFVVI
jgi:hypothetical protein